jgi:SAM-dependent methyltransferase
MKRMRWFANNYLDSTRELEILDVGSYDVNGSYREIFAELGFKYVGLDMEAGPNVDIVPKSTYIWSEVNDDHYDAVISGQALEHIEFFWITMAEIIRVTKQGGMICIIAPNGFGEHRYPVDCWRFFTDGMIALARFYNLEVLHAHTNAAPNTSDIEWYSEKCADSMLIAKKPYAGKGQQVDLKNYVCEPENHEGLMGELKTYEEYIQEKNNEETKEGNQKLDKAKQPTINARRKPMKQRFKDVLKKLSEGIYD